MNIPSCLPTMHKPTPTRFMILLQKCNLVKKSQLHIGLELASFLLVYNDLKIIIFKLWTIMNST